MKCFTHRGSDAVAVCRSCGRALCPDCIAEVGLSCACKNRCESDVARFNEMLARARPGAKLVGYDRIIFLMVMGLAFAGFGLYDFGDRGLSLFMLVLGTVFFIFGISQFFVTRKFRAEVRDRR